MKYCLSALLLVGLMHLRASPTYAADPLPGGMQLLDGYQCEMWAGVDSAAGRIFKLGGLLIKFELVPPSMYKIDESDLKWSRKQVIGGCEIITSLTKGNLLTIGYPSNPNLIAPAIFSAVVKTPEDAAEMMLMVLTYPKPRPPTTLPSSNQK